MLQSNYEDGHHDLEQIDPHSAISVVDANPLSVPQILQLKYFTSKNFDLNTGAFHKYNIYPAFVVTFPAAVSVCVHVDPSPGCGGIAWPAGEVNRQGFALPSMAMLILLTRYSRGTWFEEDSTLLKAKS